MTFKGLQFIKDNRHLTVDEIIKHFEAPEIKKYKDRTEYRLFGELYRTDGPAVEYSDGTKYWYKNGKQHRIDGPAVEYSYGSKYWYKHGKQVEPF